MSLLEPRDAIQTEFFTDRHYDLTSTKLCLKAAEANTDPSLCICVRTPYFFVIRSTSGLISLHKNEGRSLKDRSMLEDV